MKNDIVSHTAKLANLTLTPERKHSIEEQFSQILEYFEEIKSMDLDQVEVTSRVIEEINIVREDVVTPSFTQEQALQNTKHQHDGFFVVDAIFENKDA